MEFGTVPPFGLALGSNNETLVLDVFAKQVIVLDGEGQPLRRFGRSGDGPGEFRTPVLVAASLRGHFAVADLLAQRVSFFGPEGFATSVPLRLEDGVPTRMRFVGDELLEDAIWGYEDPFDEVSGLKGYVAFYLDRFNVLGRD